MNADVRRYSNVDNTIRDAALDYAAAAMPVLPLDGKIPRNHGGLTNASMDVMKVAEWWRRWPDANVGVVTGQASGYVVLDVDVPAGLRSLAELERRHGEIRTARVLTGSGGLHLWFRCPCEPIRNSAGGLGEGLDVRGEGGYVVVPPSVHESGNPYKWTRELEHVTAYPDWLLEDARKRRNGAAPVIGDVIPQGERDSTLTSLAGSMRRRGMSEAAMLAALRVENERCAPKLPESDLERIARSVAQYAPGENTPSDSGRSDDEATSSQDREQVRPLGLAWRRLSEVEMRSIVFLDRPLWQASAFHLVVGRTGVGKGTMLADVAARVTRGELGPKCIVVWIGSEDSAAIDIKPRLVAAAGDPERVVTLTDHWLQLPRDIAPLRSTALEIGDVGLVIVDPVGNHITGKDSNSDTDIRDAIAPLNDLADELETMIVGVRHLTEKECKSGALAAILGSSAWVQVPRAVIGIARDNEDAAVSHVQCLSGNRLPPDTPGSAFRIDGVMLDGLANEVTKAVWTGDSTKNVETLIGETRKQPSKSDAARELILDVLEDAPSQRVESDELDALVARETGLAAQTIRNLRAELKNDGLIRAVPVKDYAGLVERWLIERTLAPRPDNRRVTGLPVTDSEDDAPESGSTTPLTDHEPAHTLTVTGLTLEPVTESLDIEALAPEEGT